MEFLKLLEGIRTPFFDTVLGGLTYIGSEVGFFALGLFFIWCVNKWTGFYIMCVNCTGLIGNQFLKMIYRIPRPWVNDPAFTIVENARSQALGYSFPSGHSSNVMGIFMSIALRIKKWWVWILSIALIAIVAFSRMYLGVHYPSDVIVGLATTFVVALIMYPVFKNIEQHPKRIFCVLGVMILMVIAYTIYIYTYPFPADVDAVNLDEARKSSGLMLGCGLGMFVGLMLDQKYLNFDTKAVWWAQIIKFVVGIGLVLLIKSAPKWIFGDYFWVHAVRYALVCFFVTFVWPLTFKFFGRLGRKNG